MIHYDIKIYGDVQGVSFRYEAQKKAGVFGISGFVRNEPDGTVLLEIEGDEAAAEKFVEWCRTGPTYAKIEKIDVRPADIKHYKDFKIVYE